MPRHRDHAMIGNWQDCRDCHIKPDLVLIYQNGSTTQNDVEMRSAMFARIFNQAMRFVCQGFPRTMLAILLNVFTCCAHYRTPSSASSHFPTRGR